MKNAVWLVLALCLFTSCSSEKGEPNASGRPEVAAPSGVPTPTSNVSVAPADPAWPEDEAAQGYRNAIGTVTAELAKLSEMSPKAGLRKTQGALRAYSKASTAAVESLLRGRWSDEVRATVNILIAALLDQQKYFDSLATGNSTASIRAQAEKTGQVLLVTKYWSAELEKKLGVSEGLLDQDSPSAAQN